MKTPNPQGMVRCTVWDHIANAVAKREAHWSFDEKRRKRQPNRRAAIAAATLKAI